MINRFHLAIPAGDLDVAIKFYCNILGCDRGDADFKYPDAWVDINFWGNELTLHATDSNKGKKVERHNVDMGNVSVPHFGVHLDRATFDKLKHNLEQHKKIQIFQRKTGIWVIQRYFSKIFFDEKFPKILKKFQD